MLQPPAESHRVFLNQKLPKAAFAVSVSALRAHRTQHSAPGEARTGSDLLSHPTAPSSKDLVCSQAHHRGTQRREHGTFLQSTQRNSCCDVPTRGFLAPGFVALGFIYSGSANSQDESETKKCFIKKESIII